jgi:hypothetical protein
MGVGWHTAVIPKVKEALERRFSTFPSFEMDYESDPEVATFIVHIMWNVSWMNADKKYDSIECDIDVSLRTKETRVIATRTSSEQREKQKTEEIYLPAFTTLDAESIIKAVEDGYNAAKKALESRFSGWR